MSHDIIDERFIGALHLRALSHAGLEHDRATDHVTVQAGTLDALMKGGYEGDTTIADLLRLGDTGIGTIQQLDGELIVIDGEAWTATAGGEVRRVDPETRTPFAVVCHFTPTAERAIHEPLDGDALREALDAIALPGASVVAVRVEHGVRPIRLDELGMGDRVGEPPVVGLARKLQYPARHRDGDPVAASSLTSG